MKTILLEKNGGYLTINVPEQTGEEAELNLTSVSLRTGRYRLDIMDMRRRGKEVLPVYCCTWLRALEAHEHPLPASTCY